MFAIRCLVHSYTLALLALTSKACYVHKYMNKTPTWISAAYKTTQVYWGKSQSQIMTMLEQLGINQIRFTSMPDRFILEFMAKFDERSIPKAVRIIIPLHTKTTDNPDARNRELNIIHRILLNHLKAKFVAIGNGLAEFEQEFMSHLVVTDKAGRSTTMGEMLLPQYEKSLEDKSVPQFRIGDGN